MFKVKNRNIRTRCEICSKLIIKTPEQHHWRRIYFTPCSTVSIANFEQVKASWVLSVKRLSNEADSNMNIIFLKLIKIKRDSPSQSKI